MRAAEPSAHKIFTLLLICVCTTIVSAYVYGNRGGGAYGRSGLGGYAKGGAIYGSGGGTGAQYGNRAPYRPPVYRGPVYGNVPGPLYGYNNRPPIYGGNGGHNDYYYPGPAPQPPLPPAAQPTSAVPTSSLAPQTPSQSTQQSSLTVTTAQTPAGTTTTAQMPPGTPTISGTITASGDPSTVAATDNGGNGIESSPSSTPTAISTGVSLPSNGGGTAPPPPSLSTGSPGGADNNTLVVRPQFGTERTCMSTAGLDGPIVSNLNRQFTNGTFSVFVSNATGACGWQLSAQNDSRSMLAAVSRQLFNDRNESKESCLPGSIPLRNDPVCMDKCVNIFYPKTGKTLTCPIEHQCANCAIDQVQLSSAAFRFLEPNGAIGNGTGARITFVECV